MSNIVTVGYITEGTTDKRFLEAIIKNTVEEIASNCPGQLDVYDPVYLNPPKGATFIENAINAAKAAFDNGIYILCIHCDSDDVKDFKALTYKINPAIDAINNIETKICKTIVPIVPITMSESWMLADKDLLRSELETELSEIDLNINKPPESIADPKSLIEEALRIAQSHLPKRRFKLTIGEIYQPIGQKISIEKLENLTSFKKFRISLENAFKELNYLH